MELNLKQAEFRLLARKFKYSAYVAGFGSGKTFLGCAGVGEHFGENPGVRQGYFAPTYRDIRDVFYPTIQEVAELLGARVKVRKGDHEVDWYWGRKYYGTIICRSMDDPDSIVGFKIGNALVDELDILKQAKARKAWEKIVARLRWKAFGVRNGIQVTTTPEGFRFTYNKFKKNPTESYGMVQASTFDNEKFLPDDYIDGMIETYDPKMAMAYVNGQFVNMASGQVYPSYSRVLNCSFETMDKVEALHIGMDFNVRKMAAVTHVIRGSKVHAVDEFFKIADTPAMIEAIKAKYWRSYTVGRKTMYEKTREIHVYPDASGHNTSSKNSNESDHSLLEEAGFNVIVQGVNPAIRDRVNAMNSAFCNGKGIRAYFINPNRCPEYSSCIEQQAYDAQGNPDKQNDLDHLPDGGGYFIATHLPVVRPVSLAGIGFAQ